MLARVSNISGPSVRLAMTSFCNIDLTLGRTVLKKTLGEQFFLPKLFLNSAKNGLENENKGTYF